MRGEKKGYSLKAHRKTHPHKYDRDSRAFEEGAHKHWRGCYRKDGSLNAHGQIRLRLDRQALALGREMRYGA